MLLVPREDPDLDEAVAQLDWAYHNREMLKEMGNLAAEGMSSFTWKDRPIHLA